MSILIGWVAKRALDYAWGNACIMVSWIAHRFPYTLVKRSRIKDLEHRSRCLAALTKACNELPSMLPGSFNEDIEVQKWPH